MRRLFHVVRDVPIEEARALCPNDDFEDADYNASWVDSKDSKEPHENNNKFYNKGDLGSGEEADKTVTMVRAQWWERVPVWRVMDPTNPDNILTVEKDEFDDLYARVRRRADADPDVDVVDPGLEDYGMLKLHNFYVRYRLPLMVEVQHYEYAAP